MPRSSADRPVTAAYATLMFLLGMLTGLLVAGYLTIHALR